MDDLISRQAAIDKLKSIITDREYTSITDEAKERMARKFFADIPSSAQPELIEKTAYIRGFEQGRTQGMIDSQGGKK